MDNPKPLPLQTLKRLPGYYAILKSLQHQGVQHVSAPAVAKKLSQSEIQVRKDLAAVSASGGKPRMGFEVSELIDSIGLCLGYNNINDAVLVGVGKLGSSLLSYEGFREYGVNILAGFDIDAGPEGRQAGGKPVLPMEKLEGFCRRIHVHIGIITVPDYCAQEVCDRLVAAGILAIWNFSPVHLMVPGHVLVEDENMAISLSMLSKSLARKMREEEL